MALAPVLPLHKVVPSWTLPLAGDGPSFSLHKPRGRAHTVLIVADATIQIAPYAAELAPQLDEIKDLPARGVVVVSFPSSPATAGAVHVPALSASLQTVVDAEGKVRKVYLPAEAKVGVFILDRYNDLYHQWIGASEADMPPVAEVVDWLEAVGRQCGI